LANFAGHASKLLGVVIGYEARDVRPGTVERDRPLSNSKILTGFRRKGEGGYVKPDVELFSSTNKASHAEPSEIVINVSPIGFNVEVNGSPSVSAIVGVVLVVAVVSASAMTITSKYSRRLKQLADSNSRNG
jgi:hypothetical protein